MGALQKSPSNSFTCWGYFLVSFSGGLLFCWDFPKNFYFHRSKSLELSIFPGVMGAADALACTSKTDPAGSLFQTESRPGRFTPRRCHVFPNPSYKKALLLGKRGIGEGVKSPQLPKKCDMKSPWVLMKSKVALMSEGGSLLREREER